MFAYTEGLAIYVIVLVSSCYNDSYDTISRSFDRLVDKWAKTRNRVTVGSSSHHHSSRIIKKGQTVTAVETSLFLTLHLLVFYNFALLGWMTDQHEHTASIWQQSSLQADRPSPGCQQTANPPPTLNLKFHLMVSRV